MPDAMESIGEDMDQKAADELRCSQAHDLLAVTAFDTVILPAEGYSIGIGADQSVVRDGDPMCVSAQICQDRPGPPKGGLA